MGAFRSIEGATGAPITVIAHPVRYDGEAPDVRLPPQPLGAQTREVLSEAGFAGDEIDGFFARGIVRGAA
jgi:crotonobetainyl-CoA:carnitine CoA-transferase CaiB-like acyl-CoA transferase